MKTPHNIAVAIIIGRPPFVATREKPSDHESVTIKKEKNMQDNGNLTVLKGKSH